jgi:DNA primase
VCGRPRVFTTTEWLVRDCGDRAYLATQSNYPGTGGSLPYSLRGTPDLPVIVPIPWDRIAGTFDELVVAADLAAYLDHNGDLFATRFGAIGPEPAPQETETAGRTHSQSR